MKVLMLPTIDQMQGEESGIVRVNTAYYKYLPEFGVELVKEQQSYDLKAVHAGCNTEAVDISLCHGLYFSADYPCNKWEYKTNGRVIETLRQAKKITVPSAWVAEIIKRDMRRVPTIIGHGIEWNEWQAPHDEGDFVLYNKNRQGDSCDSTPVGDLARAFHSTRFVSTFSPKQGQNNIAVIGVIPHEQMKLLVQASMVYFAPTKETFGIGILEAMAAAKPVLGYAHGGIVDLVKHGVNGYLARPGDVEDLKEGLAYCLQHRKTLGENGREMAKQYTWQESVKKLVKVFEEAMVEEPARVTVVIPSYNYSTKVERAIDSVTKQTFKDWELFVVDDGSTDDSEKSIPALLTEMKDSRLHYIRQNNQGVAIARNTGIAAGTAKYVCCLDADDAIEPTALETLIKPMEKDHSLGLTYCGLRYIMPSGKTGVSPWPPEWDFDKQLKRQNQVPTFCLYRREAVEALGGYKKRYCPDGAGSEDAELWTRFGAYGWKCQKVTAAPLFVYSQGTGRVSGNKSYNEPDWLAWHPWVTDEKHPFASYATPRQFSHPVRQYDEPIISVIIPVGPNHAENVEDALDSVEAQTYRKWETIVVWDRDDLPPERLTKAYPYVKWELLGKNHGSGYARNVGAKKARGAFLLFLDADDWLYPEAMQKMFDVWEQTESVVYPDFVGKAFIDNPAGLDEKLQRNILWQQDDGLTAIRYEAPEYDPGKAQAQPTGDPTHIYTWNLITSLVPKIWHDEVGGFDQDMPSWEDVDYWWRIAKRGHCFVRIPEPLVVYHFYSGGRRDFGHSQHQKLFQYLIEKHERIEVIMCSGCGGKPKANTAAPVKSSTPRIMVADENFKLCVYKHPNRGQHPVIGQALFRDRVDGINMIANDRGWRIHYGFRGGGEKFLVHIEDVRIAGHLFEPMQEALPAAPISQLSEPIPVVIDLSEGPPPAPKRIDMAGIMEPFDLQKLSGVTAKIAEQMNERGVRSAQDIVDKGIDWITTLKGVSDVRAKTILESAQNVG